MQVIERLKKRNRTVLEMETGILFYGLVCQMVGALIVKNQQIYACSLWIGILCAIFAVHHMRYVLDTALDFDEKNAAKLIFRGYIIRYVAFVVVIMAIIFTKVLNPLITFMAYMSLKVAVYLQPFTHKIYNKLFHETDPIPQPMEEEDVLTPKEET